MRTHCTAIFFALWLGALPLSAGMETPPSQEMQKIDEKIQELKQKKHELHIEAMQNEVYSQRLLFEKGSEYTDRIRKVEAKEEEEKSIQLKIEDLEAQKLQLQKQAPHQP